MNQNPFITALELVQKYEATDGQTALAKCILSLYNEKHAFSIGEVLGPIGGEYKAVVLQMVSEYAMHGESKELCQAGVYVYQNFPRLVELSNAMSNARFEVRQEWQQLQENEMLGFYPDD